MKIQKIKVNNFRLLKDFELDFRNNTSLLVGKNNCGKTSVITILEKFLGSSEPRISWNDFTLNFQKSFWEKLQSFEQSINEYVAEGIILQVFVEYSNEDNYSIIQHFMMDLDPKNNVIVLEFFYSCKFDMFKLLKGDLQIAKITNFEEFSLHMNKYANKYFKLQRYSRGFDFETNETNDEISDNVNFSEIKKLINIRTIKANREASNKVNDSSLSGLSQKYYNIQSDGLDLDMTDLQVAIQAADKTLSEAYNGGENSTGIFREIFDSIKKFGSETDIMIQSSISEADLFKNNTTLYYTSDGHNLPENYNGLGYLNLIGMIFEIETIISEFHGKENEIPSEINLLFIEEPEAHTHPQLQYIFIKNIKQLLDERKNKGAKNLEIQTIITTHSSHIVSECDFADVRYLVRKKDYVVSKNFQELQKQYQSEPEAFRFIKQHLTLNRSELFFTDKAIFIEGDTERILLPAMMQKVDEEHNEDKEYLPLLSQNISIIESGAYSHTFKPLIEFLDIKALVITDIDGTRSNGGKACRSSEAKFTSNASLKKFFELPKNGTQFIRLTDKTFEDKNINGKIQISYQTSIQDLEEGEYQPRSFEDSFICENFDYIKANKENFTQGLKNRPKLDVSTPDWYDIADKCISKKSAFASEILYWDGLTEERKWIIPGYIKEGLEWLQV